jgi:hypothetical protein
MLIAHEGGLQGRHGLDSETGLDVAILAAFYTIGVGPREYSVILTYFHGPTVSFLHQRPVFTHDPLYLLEILKTTIYFVGYHYVDSIGQC